MPAPLQKPHRLSLLAAALVLGVARLALSADSPALDAIDAAQRTEAARIALIERIAPAVVCIFDEGERGGGSGVIIDPRGYGLTNFHVVADMLATRKGLGGLSDGKLYDLEVLGVDPGGDVAMFKLSGRDAFPWVPLGDSDRVRVGDTALALGNPFVLSEDYAPTVTMGIVSGIHRYQWGSGDKLLYSDCIQVDASINPGNSGGPLFNLDGQVIGINGRISVSIRGRVNVGMGYAITANQIAPFIPGLRAGLLVEHGTLQAIVRDRPEGDVVFVELLEDGPAWNVGIRPGDILSHFEGRPIASANEFASILGTLPADWPVAVTYSSNGETVTRIARTEPIQLPEAAGFEVDTEVNGRAVDRVVDRFRMGAADSGQAHDTWIEVHHFAPVPGQAADNAPDSERTGRHTTYEVTAARDGAMRYVPRDAKAAAIRVTADQAMLEKPGGEQPLPTDLDLAYRALYHLHNTLLAIGATRPADARHTGADRRIELDTSGRIVVSEVLECVTVPLSEHADARFAFSSMTGELRQVRATDRAIKETVEMTIDSAAGWPPAIHVACSSGSFTITRPDAKSIGPHTDMDAPLADSTTSEPPLTSAIAYVSQRVVKLFGAKVGRSEGYGSGIIVSPDGLVVTVDSALLDASNVRAVLGDGSVRRVELVRSDRDMHLALLRLLPLDDTAGAAGADADADGEPSPYPHFDLHQANAPVAGQRVLAAGNPFKVASGAEAISIALGAFSGTVKLDATRGGRDFPYRGDVLLTDVITSTPGYPGGALTDRDGRLLGMIGRVVNARATHTMLNHALPASVLSQFVTHALDPATAAPGETAQAPPGYHGIKFFELGYRSNPVYVERVQRGSPAARAGVRKDDLVIGANGRPVPTLEALERVLSECHAGDTLELTVLRNDEVRKFSIVLEDAP